jgi:hypothetical protein
MTLGNNRQNDTYLLDKFAPLFEKIRQNAVSRELNGPCFLSRPDGCGSNDLVRYAFP